MSDLNILERSVLMAISNCSVYSFGEVEKVYRECESFDSTIVVLKHAQMLVKSLDDIMEGLRGRGSKHLAVNR